MIATKSVFAAFCTSRHPTCQALRPAFDKLSGLMEDTDVTIAWVDCDRVRRECVDLGQTNYPRVQLYEDGGAKASYGDRVDAEAMRLWLLVNSDAD